MNIIEPIISASHPSEDFQIIGHNLNSLYSVACEEHDLIGGAITHYTLTLDDVTVDAEKFMFVFQQDGINVSVSSLTWVGKHNNVNILELTYATRHNFFGKGYASQIVKIALKEVSKVLLERDLSEIWLIAKVGKNNLASIKIAEATFIVNPVTFIDPFENTELMLFQKKFRSEDLARI